MYVVTCLDPRLIIGTDYGPYHDVGMAYVVRLEAKGSNCLCKWLVVNPIVDIVSLEAKGSNCLCKWLVVNPILDIVSLEAKGSKLSMQMTGS